MTECHGAETRRQSIRRPRPRGLEAPGRAMPWAIEMQSGAEAKSGLFSAAMTEKPSKDPYAYVQEIQLVGFDGPCALARLRYCFTTQNLALAALCECPR